jgi:MFS family permease
LRRSTLSLDRELTLREVLLAWVVLAGVATLAFYPHIRHGGFYSDDWSNGALSLLPPEGPGFGHAISAFADLTIYRPVLVIYVPLTYAVFGLHMHVHLLWTAFLALCVAGLLYGVLRMLGVPWIHALVIAVLTILFPWFDSTRLWVTGTQLSLSISFFLAGLWIALAGLSRSSWRWHTGAVSLYLLSILTYEITLPLVAVIGLLYVLRAAWAEARTRWAIDFGVAIAAGIWVSLHTERTASGLSGAISHLGKIITNGGTLFGRSLLPLGPERTSLVILVFALVLVAGTGVYLRGTGGSKEVRWGLGSWLMLAVGGVVVAAAGWVAFIPADPYYTPSIYGVTNRVNGLSGFGLVIAAYGAFGILGSLVGGIRIGRPGVLALATTLLLAAALGASYASVLHRHIGIWNSAYAAERTGLNELRARDPNMPTGSTLFVAGYPAYQTLGVPIMSANWDLDGMVKLEYDDNSLKAFPILEGTKLACRSGGVGLTGEGASGSVAPYGTAHLLNLATGKRARPRNRRVCLAVAGEYAPGPFYLSYGY